ncbi:N-acetylglucosamine 6-phosphate deacetylase [Shimia gijangensis]|uniref:N-acetylglucosamine 6-phosphate deacetylase n=1 Tax=Shimia gijangensis TaxID=1470563 RepID=A0A1M6ITZ7_9RHOB|nr:N-acetylglucosamine-6-phosphate deacetylase [Shimia gijangensis]SHJ37933.1 N-acetylglucosamine 6-phosphate deacetylase [Shimia gijangensis]
MSKVAKAYVGARIHDGVRFHDDHALVIYTDGSRDLIARSELSNDNQIKTLPGGIILPGYVDLQVNGGGGVMFNDDQSVDALRTIAKAHASIGTAALLPTLITDTPDRTKAAIRAVEQAIAAQVAGIAGIHLEGPHLSIARKGAHDPGLIRRMTETDLAIVLDAANRLPNVMMTVAPENTTNSQIRTMTDAGVIVSLGHTDADFETCMAAFDAGALCVTHLFNAMSQLGNREPGLVGATLARGNIYAGLIADAIHVHPTVIRIALAAAENNERIMLVTDAMATAGSRIDGFVLNGRHVIRKDQRLTLQDGTLAGADLEMTRALSTMVNKAGDGLSCAIRRATATPLSLLKGFQHGSPLLDSGLFVNHLPDDLSTFTRLGT